LAGQPRELEFDIRQIYEVQHKKNGDQAFYAYASLVLLERGHKTDLLLGEVSGFAETVTM
jgi:hypothetical protein